MCGRCIEARHSTTGSPQSLLIGLSIGQSSLCIRTSSRRHCREKSVPQVESDVPCGEDDQFAAVPRRVYPSVWTRSMNTDTRNINLRAIANSNTRRLLPWTLTLTSSATGLRERGRTRSPTYGSFRVSWLAISSQGQRPDPSQWGTASWRSCPDSSPVVTSSSASGNSRSRRSGMR